MEALLQALKNPGAMSNSQWLLLAIMVFVLLGSAYLVFRIYRIIVADRKSTYVPNIGRKRLNQEKEKSSESGK